MPGKVAHIHGKRAQVHAPLPSTTTKAFPLFNWLGSQIRVVYAARCHADGIAEVYPVAVLKVEFIDKFLSEFCAACRCSGLARMRIARKMPRKMGATNPKK